MRLHAVARHFLDRAGERRLQPLLRADLALKAKHVRILPGAHFADQPHRRLDVLRVGIALFDQRHRQSVRAEDQVHFLADSEAAAERR